MTIKVRAEGYNRKETVNISKDTATLACRLGYDGKTYTPMSQASLLIVIDHLLKTRTQVMLP